MLWPRCCLSAVTRYREALNRSDTGARRSQIDAANNDRAVVFEAPLGDQSAGALPDHFAMALERGQRIVGKGAEVLNQRLDRDTALDHFLIVGRRRCQFDYGSA